MIIAMIGMRIENSNILRAGFIFVNRIGGSVVRFLI